MKAIRKNLIVAAVLMLGTLTNYANTEKISKKIKLVFENVEKNHFLSVKDHSGVTLYKENIVQSGNLVKLFDFSSLKNGKYTVEVEKEFEILIKEIKVVNSNVTLTKDSEKVIFRPVIHTKDDTVLISRINFDKLPLHVAIYYKGYLIEEEIIYSDKKVIEKAYKLDKALKGDYDIYVSNEKTSSTKEFKI